MSVHVPGSLPARPLPLRLPWLDSFRPARLFARLAARHRRRRDLEMLRDLDDHFLRDIGLTRADVEAALRAPEGSPLRAEADG